MSGASTGARGGRRESWAKRGMDATGVAEVGDRAGAETYKTPVEEMQAASVMFSMNGGDKKKFMEAVKADPHTYKDWESGEWTVETTGKEDKMFSPFLKKPFKQALEAGVIPAHLQTISGTWGRFMTVAT